MALMFKAANVLQCRNTISCNGVKPELILKSRLSSDYSLKLENIKMKSLVIADQHAAVNEHLDLHSLPVKPCFANELKVDYVN